MPTSKTTSIPSSPATMDLDVRNVMTVDRNKAGHDGMCNPALSPVCASTKRRACSRPQSIGLKSFEGQIIGEVESADARRIAAAAEVLGQQSVVELRLPEADLPADLGTDPAAADAMAFRLPFGHVEGMAERAQELRQPDFLLLVHNSSSHGERNIPSACGACSR